MKVLSFENGQNIAVQPFLNFLFDPNGPKISGNDKFLFSVLKEYEITH